MRAKKYNKPSSSPTHNDRITVEWLHDVAPLSWLRGALGVMSGLWSINRCNGNVWVWAHHPTHDAQMRKSSNRSWYAIVVLETKEDVMRIFDIATLCGTYDG